jgi:hypothetical protein
VETGKSKKWDKTGVRNSLVNIAAVAGLAMLIYSGLAAIFGERAVPTVSAQQDLFVARRIDQMEQRINTIESRLNRIESDSRMSSITASRPANNNETELRLLQSQVDGFRLRLGEVECGLLRVDERTLTAAARAARKRGAESEICRRDAGAAVQLSARP